jgi:hypothetical protein
VDDSVVDSRRKTPRQKNRGMVSTGVHTVRGGAERRRRRPRRRKEGAEMLRRRKRVWRAKATDYIQQEELKKVNKAPRLLQV